jgi:hypothetical protein
LQQQAEQWSVARNAREPLCWALWERGSIAIAGARRTADGPGGPETKRCLGEARHAADEGMRIARACGFGIFHIDLLLLRAEIALEEGDATATIVDARTALVTGHTSPLESGQPRLFAAGDPECSYAWGVAQAHHLLAEALFHQTAQQLGRPDVNISRPPAEILPLLTEASGHLDACRKMRACIQDPALARSESLLRDLTAGVLTRYPLQQKRTRS